jgi:hypothetical protein
LADKESQRWIATANAAKPLLAGAAMVTSIGDRESDIFAAYASVPEPRFHVIARTCMTASSPTAAACMPKASTWRSSTKP